MSSNKEKIILDYSSGAWERGSIWDKELFRKDEKARDLYLTHKDTMRCPYCKSKTVKVLNAYQKIENDISEDRHFSENIYGCKN